MRINNLIDDLYSLKLQKLKLANELYELEQKIIYIEELIIPELRSEGLLKASTTLAAVSVQIQAFPYIANWKELEKYILNSRDLTVLKKEIKVAVWRAFKNKGFLIPGTDSYEKDVLHYHKLKKSGDEE